MGLCKFARDLDLGLCRKKDVSVMLGIYGFVTAFDGKLQLGCMHKSFHKVYMLFACVTYLLLPFIF